MDLRKLWKVFLRWWWLAVIPVVVVAGYVGLTFQKPPTYYQVVMRFTAGGEPAPTLSADYDRYHAWLSSEYIARALANVAVTGDFAANVADRLAEKGHSIAAGAIQSAIITDYAESFTVIYLTWGDGNTIVAVADAVSDEIVHNGAAYFPQMQGIGPVAQRVDDPNPIPLSPSLKAQLTGPALRLILAVAVGGGLIFIVHYLDPLTRDREEVEALGIRVLATIPKSGK